MRKAPLLLLLLCLAGPASAGDLQSQVLVLTTPSRVDTGRKFRKAVEVQNLGPNPIYCTLRKGTSDVPAVGTARRIASGEAWGIELKADVQVWCIAGTAQLTGAATIVTEAI